MSKPTDAKFNARPNDFLSFKAGAPLVPKDVEVKALNLPALEAGNRPSYQEIKSHFRQGFEKKSLGFLLSEHVSSQLSVEEEERLRFEKLVHDEAERRLVDLRKQAHDEGFQAGAEKGRAEAFEAERARLAKVIESLGVLMGAVAKAKNELAAQYEEKLVELGFKVGKILVHHEIETHPENVHHTIRAILDLLAKEDDVRVRLSPAEFDVTSEIKKEIDLLLRPGRVSFELDQTLASGDVVVESGSGEIASKIEDKFSKLQGLLGESVRRETEKKRAQGGVG